MAKKARSLPVARREVSPERREAFLAQLRDHGVVVWAAIAASPHIDDRKGAASSFYTLRRKDPGFSAEWDDALAEANDKLIIEARKRAIDGVPRLRTFKDQLIYVEDPETGEKRPIVDVEYSDKLLEILLKGGHPDTYVERRLIEHTNRQTAHGWTITSEDLAVLDDRETEALYRIVGKIREARGEIEPDRSEATANMIDVTPDEPMAVIKVADGDTLAALEALEVAG